MNHEWTAAEVKDKIALLMNKQGWQWHQVEAIIKAALADEKETSRYWKEQWVERGAQLAVLTRENDGRDQREAEYAGKMVAEIQARDKQLAALQEENKTFRAAQKACEDCDGPTMAEVQQMREQLVAEKKKVSVAGQGLKLAADTIQQLRDQLAAATARELKSYDVAKRCRDELAAELDKIEQLAYALHFYRNHHDNGQTATDALLKAGLSELY